MSEPDTWMPPGRTLLRWLLRAGLLLVSATGWMPAQASLALDPDFRPAFTTTHGAVVFALAVQADGRVLMAGDFAFVQGQPRRGLARLQPNGYLDDALDAGTGVDGLIYALAVQPDDGRIIVGGRFQTCRGEPRSALARLEIDGTLDRGFAPVLSGPPGWFVSSIVAEPSGKILVAGGFDEVNGLPRRGLVRFLASGAVDPSFDPGAGPSGGAVHDVVMQRDGQILVGGAFTSIGGVAQPGLARLDPQGRVDETFRSRVLHQGAAGRVYAIALDAERGIVIGGVFDQVGDLARVGLARVRFDGSTDAGFDPRGGLGGAAGTSFDLAALEGGAVLVTGSFSSAAGLDRMSVARLDPTGAGDRSFDPSPGLTSDEEAFGNVVAVQRDGRVLVAGQFREAGGVARHCVARLLPNGAVDPGFSSADAWLERPGSVRAVAPLEAGDVLVGGDFERVNQVQRYGLARLDKEGAVVMSFDAQLEPGSVINAIAVQSGERFLIGGRFGSVGDAERSNFARVFDDGRPDLDFAAPGAEAAVHAIALTPDGQIVVGGEFRQFGNWRRFGMVRLDADGEPDLEFEPRFEIGWGRAAVQAVVPLTDGGLVVGGYFDQVNGQPRRALVRLESSGALHLGFDPDLDSENTPTIVCSIAGRADGRIVVGGRFERVAQRPCGGLARLYPDGRLDASFDPGLEATRSDGAKIEALGLLSDGRVVVGGEFEQPGGQPFPHFAVLSNLGSIPPTDAATPTLAGPVHTLRVQGDGAVLVGGSFWRAFGELRYGLARITAGKAAWERGLAITASGGELRVHWDGPGRLLEADEITGPWRPVPQDESPYAPPTGHEAGFYRWAD